VEIQTRFHDSGVTLSTLVICDKIIIFQLPSALYPRLSARER
jgi:hypothetical protein